MHVNAHLDVVVVVVSCYLLPQGACGDEAADTDSDVLSDVDTTDTDSDSDVLALEDGAGTESSNQLHVSESAVKTALGT